MLSRQIKTRYLNFVISMHTQDGRTRDLDFVNNAVTSGLISQL